jgi:hypothetical protein
MEPLVRRSRLGPNFTNVSPRIHAPENDGRNPIDRPPAMPGMRLARATARIEKQRRHVAARSRLARLRARGLRRICGIIERPRRRLFIHRPGRDGKPLTIGPMRHREPHCRPRRQSGQHRDRGEPQGRTPARGRTQEPKLGMKFRHVAGHSSTLLPKAKLPCAGCRPGGNARMVQALRRDRRRKGSSPHRSVTYMEAAGWANAVNPYGRHRRISKANA